MTICGVCKTPDVRSLHSTLGKSALLSGQQVRRIALRRVSREKPSLVESLCLSGGKRVEQFASLLQAGPERKEMSSRAKSTLAHLQRRVVGQKRQPPRAKRAPLVVEEDGAGDEEICRRLEG